MQPDKLEKLKKLLELTNEGLTRNEFLESFKKVMDQIFKLEAKLIEKIDYKTKDETDKLNQLKDEFAQVIEKAKEESDNSLSGFKRKTVELVNSLFAKSKVNQKLGSIIDNAVQKLDELDYKMSMIKNGIDGVNGTDGRDGIDGKDADEEAIKNKILEELEDELKALKKSIEELKTRKLGGGGGFSYIAMKQHIIDNETPSGTVNGTNKAFTLAHIPNPTASLKVYVNGMRMKSGGEDFTLSGSTITFVTAPPATSIITCDYQQ